MKKDVNLDSRTAYKSISRIAKILSCLSDGKNAVTEIAQYCELSNPTASRLLQALEKSKFVIRDPVHRKYFLGPLLNFLVANPKTTHFNLITLSVGEMNHLSEICGETVILAVLVGIQNILLHIIPSRQNIRIYEDYDVNLTNPQFLGAGPKALLSQLGRRELAILMNNINLESMTNNSMVDKKEYIRQLNQIKKQGYAISHGERIAGALMISAPIKGYHFPAVLSVVGIESSLKPRVPELLPEIMAGANRISRNLSKPFKFGVLNNTERKKVTKSEIVLREKH